MKKLTEYDKETIRTLYFEFNNSIVTLSRSFKVDPRTIRYWIRNDEYRKEVLEKNRKNRKLREIKKLMRSASLINGVMLD